MSHQQSMFPIPGGARKTKPEAEDNARDVKQRGTPVSAATRPGESAGSHGQITLYHGDCIEAMEKTLDAEIVDVIVTSPPYNIGVAYGSYDDSISRGQYLDWIERWGRAVRRVLKPDGSLFLNVGSKPSDPWVPFEVAGRLRETLRMQNVIHWIKSIYVESAGYGEEIALNVGHFKPINSKRFLNDAHEYVFHFTRDGGVEIDRLAIGVPYKDGSNIPRWKSAGKGIRCRGNNWYIPYPTIQRRSKERPHPASFPPELAEMCIRLHGLKRVQLVLDPFLGIGNTAVASARLGMAMIGFEIDEKYLAVARTRVSECFGSERALEYP